jgi:hypothetical protein
MASWPSRRGRSAGLDPLSYPLAQATRHPRQRSFAIRLAIEPPWSMISRCCIWACSSSINCDLKAPTDAAADRKRPDFLVTAAPLPMRGGTGSHPYRDLLRGHRGFWRLAMSSNIFHREGQRLRSADFERREVLIAMPRNLPGPSLIPGWVATGIAAGVGRLRDALAPPQSDSSRYS